MKSGDKLRIAKLEFEVAIKETTKAPAPALESDTKEKKKESDSGSMEFDVTEWLDEANAKDKGTSAKKSEPDTRQFKLDETDRLALESASEQEAVSETGDSAVKKAPLPTKKGPGKLPERPKQAAANSREAAADMLKKFFNNR